tara:strand:- start:16842 stop:17774 length:933 start_codon:yes stop_codon:yes gene_type:complete
MDNVKLGLIGVGKWGTNYVKAIKGIKNVDLNYVTSNNDITENLLNKDCTIENDWRKIISSNNVDGIIVASPPNTHYEILKECIDLRIPVLIEKPFVLKVEDAQKIINFAKRKYSLVYVDYIHLHHPAFLKLEQEIKQKNDFIDIKSISGNNGPFRPDVRALWDWAPHDIAMCLKIMEEMPKVNKVCYLEKNFDYSIPGELINIELLFPSRIKANLTIGNLLKRKKKEFSVNYEEYSLIYDSNSKYSLKKSFINEKDIYLYAGFEKPLTNLVQKFVNAIVLEKIDFKDLDLSLKVTKLIQEIEMNLKLDSI